MCSGSYFGVEAVNVSNTVEEDKLNAAGEIEEENKEKDLLEHLIARLGRPCDATCAINGPAKFPFAAKRRCLNRALLEP
jgi:hypothetical protein